MKIVNYTPEEMGWVRKAPRIWEKPDGKMHIFPPNGPELIAKLISMEDDDERQGIEEPEHKRPGEPA